MRDLQRQVHKKKLRAIKMAFCIMAAFYICIFPIVLYFILWEYTIAVSCSFSNKLLFIASVMLFLSSATNPVICMTFVQSYRQALKGILCSCSSKWSPATTSRKKVENEERELAQIRHNWLLKYFQIWTGLFFLFYLKTGQVCLYHFCLCNGEN